MIAQITSPSPTVADPHFPVDFIDMLRLEWPFLATYYVIAVPVVIIFWRRLKISRRLHSVNGRMAAATMLAAVFTPGEVTDFFLFNHPGPAVIGLFMLQITAVLTVSPALIPLGIFIYVLPMALAFAFFYAALSLYHRFCVSPGPPSNHSMEPTPPD
jgi:hypothetical protein